MNKKFSARQDAMIIEVEFPEFGGCFNAWLNITAKPEQKYIHVQGKLLFEQDMLAAIHLNDLSVNTDSMRLSTQFDCATLVNSLLAFLRYYFAQQSKIVPNVTVSVELSCIDDINTHSHDQQLTFWNDIGVHVQAPASHNSKANAVLGKNGCGTSPTFSPNIFISEKSVRSMSHLQSSDISAAVNLYERYLRDGCEQLLTLNTYLLKAERREMTKQTLYRLGWIMGISSLVLIVSYITFGVNLLTAAGLLAAYFIGLFLHDKYSPGTVVQNEEGDLLKLNNKLRHEILAVEEKSNGNLYRLLEATELEQEAKTNGLKIAKGQIDIYQLDGNGLYQYLDAINLLIKHRDRLEALS